MGLKLLRNPLKKVVLKIDFLTNKEDKPSSKWVKMKKKR